MAREAFDALGIIFAEVDQSRGAINQDLWMRGGKRPDFILESSASNHIVLADAKYHKTAGQTAFALTRDEIEKYRNLKAYTEDEFPNHIVDVVFFLFPQEGLGESLALILLSDFDKGTSCFLQGEDAICVSLAERLRDPKSGEVIG